MPEIIQRIIPAGRPNRPGIKRTPKWIIIHDTANPGADAEDHARYLETTDKAVSWHYTVDDQRVVQHLPLDESAYHAGDGARGPGNMYGIGIEICEFTGGNAAARRDRAEDNAAWLVAQLLRQYGWSVDKVKQHHDFSPWKKDCPHVLRPRWGKWLDRVQHYLADGQKGEAKTMAHPVLRKGDKGQAVKELQEALKRLGHDPGPIDGIFGPKTEAAVQSFQQAAKITVDGIVGPQTWAALEAALRASEGAKPASASKPAASSQPQPVPKPASAPAPQPQPVPAPKPGPFQDVPRDHPFARAIEWAKERGITVGYSDGTFRPDQPVTRGELMQILFRALGERA